MRIKIIDRTKCESCKQRSCSLTDTITKSDFMNLKTEQYTCPVKMFAYGLTDEQIEAGYIDFDAERNECLYCCLCVIQCSQQNLLIEGYSYDARADMLKLKECGELQSQGPSNIIALSYLNILFGFAANTNLIRTLSFDGAMLTKSGNACLVEVDINNDSLECCRRLLSDLVLYNHRSDTKIKNGLMVINDFPKQGSRDVITLIKSIKSFVNTSDISIYITTFSLLRYFALNLDSGDYELNDLFFNVAEITEEEYLKKLLDSGKIAHEISSEIFKGGE